MKTFTKSSLLASTVIAGLAFANPALAQDQTGPVESTDPAVEADGAPADEEIIITGTRIARPNVESASPVTVVGAEAIAQVGTTRVEDLVNSLPQVTPGQTAFVSNGATGTATVNLRGLGAVRTLVLVNGRRLQPGSPFLPVADLNQIPASLVSRVEVLTGGASSTYGADAVAGVVNFIMDTDFEGVQLDATYGVYQHDNRNNDVVDILADGTKLTTRDRLDQRGFAYPDGNVVDGDTFDAQLTMGAGFDDGRGNVVGYVGYRRIGAILQGDRDHSSCAFTRSATSNRITCGGSFNSPWTTVVDPTFGDFFFGVAGGSDDFSDFSGPGAPPYNYAPVNFFQRPDVRWTAGAYANYEISDSVEAYAEFMFMDDRSDAQIAESGTFFGEVYNIACDSPLLTPAQGATLCAAIDGETGAGDDPVPDGVVPLLLGKRNVEGGGRNADLRHTGYRAVGGLRGDITDKFSYDFSAQYGTTIFSQAYTNDFSFSRLREALQATTDADGNIVCANPIAAANGCSPYNPFQGDGIVDNAADGVTQAALDYVQTPGLQKGNLDEWVVTGYVTGELFNITASEPVSAVVGAEYRSEFLDLQSDTAFASGDLAGQGGPSPSITGEFDVKEVFAELLVPIITDVPGVDRLSLELGYRYSDYSTGITTDTYKIAAEYSPIPEIKFRGGYNRASRAPNILELFSPQGLTLWSGVDPCAGALGADGTPGGSGFTAAQCANTGATNYGGIAASPADQYNQLSGGNTELDPEIADTFTVGVVVEGGSILPGFVATVDYFDIEIVDAIATIGAQTIVEQCARSGDAAFCDLVQRDPISQNLWAGQNGFVTNLTQNIGGLETKGIDVGLSYGRGLGAGRINADIQGTYLIDAITDTGTTSPDADGVYDCVGFHGATCGFPNPEWRHTARLAYNFDSGVGISLRWRYIGAVDLDENANDTDLGEPGSEPRGDINAHSYFDASVNFDVTDEFGFRVGVNNILDKDPPILTSAWGTDNANTWAGTYDPVGRFLFVSGTLKF